MKYKIELIQGDLKALNKKVKALEAIDKKGLSGALKIAGAQASNEAKRKAPVDTGKLRSNIGFERSPDGKSIEVFSNAEYSGYVEFGTRFQNAQPYFGPAIRIAMRNLVKTLDRLINKAIS